MRWRVTTLTVALLTVVLAVVMTAVTVSYRAELRGEVQHRLDTAAAALSRAGTPDVATKLIPGLALEGISARIDKGSAAPDARSTTTSNVDGASQMWTRTVPLPDDVTVTVTASAVRVTSSVDKLILLQLAIGLLVLAAAAALTRWTTTASLRPLADVVSVASAVTDGDRSRRLNSTTTTTEVGVLSVAFDQMLDTLAEALSEARNSELAMQRFIADAAHELRTPIAVLQASAERLLREQPDRPERDEIEVDLAAGAARLGHLTGSLLDLARLDGAGAAYVEPVRIDRLVAAVVEATRSLPGRPTVRVDAVPATVPGDAASLSRAIGNLLDNAYAAASHGNVGITVETSSGRVIVSVIDDGPGLPEADQERVFERFTRLDTARQGSGLGLAIARAIARQHGGDLTYAGGRKLGGVFTLSLPAVDV